MSLRTAICNLLSHAVVCCDKAKRASSEKGSIQSISKKGCHERFYRHIFSWFIYPLPFETSGTASRGSIWYMVPLCATLRIHFFAESRICRLRTCTCGELEVSRCLRLIFLCIFSHKGKEAVTKFCFAVGIRCSVQ